MIWKLVSHKSPIFSHTLGPQMGGINLTINESNSRELNEIAYDDIPIFTHEESNSQSVVNRKEGKLLI